GAVLEPQRDYREHGRHRVEAERLPLRERERRSSDLEVVADLEPAVGIVGAVDDDANARFRHGVVGSHGTWSSVAGVVVSSSTAWATFCQWMRFAPTCASAVCTSRRTRCIGSLSNT